MKGSCQPWELCWMVASRPMHPDSLTVSPAWSSWFRLYLGEEEKVSSLSAYTCASLGLRHPDSPSKQENILKQRHVCSVNIRSWGWVRWGSWPITGLTASPETPEKLLRPWCPSATAQLGGTKIRSGSGCPVEEPVLKSARCPQVVKWIRICPPVKQNRVLSLLGEDSTWPGATKAMGHDYWACMS